MPARTLGDAAATRTPRPRRGARVGRRRGRRRRPAGVLTARRGGVGSIWVAEVDRRRPRRRIRAAPPPGADRRVAPRRGQVAWSPDGRTLLVTDLPIRDPPTTASAAQQRDGAAALRGADAFGARLVDAPLPSDRRRADPRRRPRAPARRSPPFDRVWDAARPRTHPAAERPPGGRALRDRIGRGPRGGADEAALEAVIDAMIAEQPLDQAGDASVGRSSSRASAGLEAGARARARRQRRRCRDRRVVRARRGRARRLGHRRRRHGAGVPQGHARAGRHRLQGSGADPRDARQPGDLRDGRLGSIRAGGREHPRRGRRARPPVSPLRQQRASPGPTSSRRRSTTPTEGFVLDDALPTTIAEGQAFCRATRRRARSSCRAAGCRSRAIASSTPTTPRRCARSRAQGADAFYRGEHGPADGRRHGEARRPHHARGSRAVPRRRAAAGARRYRDHVVFSTPPPVSSGAALIEIAADARPTSRRAGRAPRPRRRLSAPADRDVPSRAPRRAVDPALWPDEAPRTSIRRTPATLFAQIDRSGRRRRRGGRRRRRRAGGNRGGRADGGAARGRRGPARTASALVAAIATATWWRSRRR